MPSDQLILGFDTSAAHCAAALICGAHVLGTVAVEMGRGQAEHLMPMLEALLEGHGRGWQDLNGIGVGIGPGNFTGIRISVAAARGLSLGLGIPATGVSTLDAIQFQHPGATAAVPAPRDMAYIQVPGNLPIIAAGEEYPDAARPPAPAELALTIARIALQEPSRERPKPMYIKPADAAPSRETGPLVLS